MKKIVLLLLSLLLGCTIEGFVTVPADFSLEIVTPIPNEQFRISDPIPLHLNITGFAFNKSTIIAKLDEETIENMVSSNYSIINVPLGEHSLTIIARRSDGEEIIRNVTFEVVPTKVEVWFVDPHEKVYSGSVPVRVRTYDFGAEFGNPGLLKVYLNDNEIELVKNQAEITASPGRLGRLAQVFEGFRDRVDEGPEIGDEIVVPSIPSYRCWRAPTLAARPRSCSVSSR